MVAMTAYRHNNMIDDLLLLSGNDIPFPEAQITIHQPTIKEVAYMGEENFFIATQLLNVSKNSLIEEDKVNLEQYSNFDILIAILKEQNAVMRKNKDCIIMILTLLFPYHEIEIGEQEIKLIHKDNREEISSINNNNFLEFQSILNKMFNFGGGDTQTEFKPAGDMARKIADKLKKRHQKLAEQKNEVTKVDIISRYASVLAIGQKLDLNSVLKLTVYQLFDQIQRYELKSGYEIYIQAKTAGASDLKEVEDWMKDIHS